MAVSTLAEGPHAVDWPTAIYHVLRTANVRQVTHVPDAGHTKLINLCQADPTMRCVTLTTEEEGVGIIAGTWLGGERGVLLMQSSGVGNCINMLSLMRTCRFPFLAIITMRGEWGEFNPWQVPMGQATRSVLRSVGVIVQDVTEAGAVAETVDAAAQLAFNGYQAVAVTIAQQVIGTKTFED